MTCTVAEPSLGETEPTIQPRSMPSFPAVRSGGLGAWDAGLLTLAVIKWDTQMDTQDFRGTSRR